MLSLKGYQKENLLARSLCELTYQNHPNFTRWAADCRLPFRSHTAFKKADVVLRQALYQRICEEIWAFPANG